MAGSTHFRHYLKSRPVAYHGYCLHSVKVAVKLATEPETELVPLTRVTGASALNDGCKSLGITHLHCTCCNLRPGLNSAALASTQLSPSPRTLSSSIAILCMYKHGGAISLEL